MNQYVKGALFIIVLALVAWAFYGKSHALQWFFPFPEDELHGHHHHGAIID